MVAVATYQTSITGTTPYANYQFGIRGENQMGVGPRAVSPTAQFNFNKATGGVESTFTTTQALVDAAPSIYKTVDEEWKVHKFENNDVTGLTVTQNPRDFYVMVVGGGGHGRSGTCGTGGYSCAGNGGGGGGVINELRPLSLGGHPVAIGNGGTGYGNPSGGTTTFGSITCTGGGSGNGMGGSAGGTPNGKSSASGEYLSYVTGNSAGIKIGHGANWPTAGASGQQGGYGSGGVGAQRTGGDYPDGTGFNGYKGAVIIAYRTG